MKFVYYYSAPEIYYHKPKIEATTQRLQKRILELLIRIANKGEIECQIFDITNSSEHIRKEIYYGPVMNGVVQCQKQAVGIDLNYFNILIIYKNGNLIDFYTHDGIESYLEFLLE